jgi:hypothetical protein
MEFTKKKLGSMSGIQAKKVRGFDNELWLKIRIAAYQNLPGKVI